MELGETSVTEGRNPASTDIDLRTSAEIVEMIVGEDAQVVPAVAAVAAQIAALADIVVERMQRGGRLIYAGAGTSGRIGALDAAECPPTYGTAPGQVLALIAGGTQALTAGVEGAEDDPEAGRRDVAAVEVGPLDIVLGIAASGRTPYVLGALAEAKSRGAFVAGLACTHPSRLAEAADLHIAPLVGPEVITGSTRMKAGTAQKLVLNALSTTVMVRLGKTYSNLTSDMQTTNAKLRGRAARIIVSAAGVELEQARQLLQAADGELKTALFMALGNLSPVEARKRLAQADGHLRHALAALQHD